MSYILGIDPSQWQGNVDFNQVKAAGYQFGIPRMTYAYPGSGCKIDPTASRNYYGLAAAGMITGGYHKVGWTDPIVEADFYLQAMSPLAEGDLLAYDIEPNSDVQVPDNWSAWEQTFVQRIVDRTHTYPLRYLNISMNNAMPAQGVVANCASWVAAPSFGWDDTVPVNVPVTIQQGPTAHIPGIPDNVCDTDAFFGTGDTNALRTQLLKLGYHAQTTPPQVQEPSTPPTPTPEPPTPDPVPVPEPQPPVDNTVLQPQLPGTIPILPEPPATPVDPPKQPQLGPMPINWKALVAVALAALASLGTAILAWIHS